MGYIIGYVVSCKFRRRHQHFGVFLMHSPSIGPGSFSSASFTLPTTSPRLTNNEEGDTPHIQKDLLFTLSTYFRSPYVSSGANDDTVTLEPTAIHEAVATHHDPHSRISISHLEELMHARISKEDYPTIGSRRPKSELDVPLTPTSTFILSPSVSISSQYEPSHAATHLSLQSKHQHNHSRAASAPLSSTSENVEVEDSPVIKNTFLPLTHIVPQSHSREFGSASSIYGGDIAMVPQRSNFAVLSNFTTPGDLSTTASFRIPQQNTNTTLLTRPSTNSSMVPPWIRSMTIELWIDQEGFRSIQPKFELAGYRKGAGLNPSGQVLDVSVFVMKNSQTWHFHHAVRRDLSSHLKYRDIIFQILDSPPVLRRLSVNGDMNDYISRQAVLVLKHNGVYAVESTEDKGKFAWKFEYLVEDRRTPETGKIMHGEKVGRL